MTETNNKQLTTNNSLPAAASRVGDMLRTAELMPLAVGRYLAETFYDASRERFQSCARKRCSLRALQKLLRQNGGMSRSFSSLRQMIAAHFQEPDLCLTEEQSLRLRWRARVELLRVKDLERKATLARECVENRWTIRKLSHHCRWECARTDPSYLKSHPSSLKPFEMHTPAMAPRTKGERLLRTALLLCRQLEDWHNAPPYDIERIREVIQRIAQDFRRVHTDEPLPDARDDGPFPPPPDVPPQPVNAPGACTQKEFYRPKQAIMSPPPGKLRLKLAERDARMRAHGAVFLGSCTLHMGTDKVEIELGDMQDPTERYWRY